MIKQLVLISKNVDDPALAEIIGKTIGLETVCFVTAAEAVQKVLLPSESVLLVDISTNDDFFDFKASFENCLGEEPGRIHPNMVHFITPVNLNQVCFLHDSTCFGNILVRNYTELADVGRHYGRVIKTLLSKTAPELRSEANNQRSSMNPVRTIKLTHSLEKTKVLEEIQTYLTKTLAFPARIANIIQTAVDELLMNAIYDARPDHDGKQAFRVVSRDTPIALDDKTAVDLKMSYDGEYVGFEVTDYFGSLDRKALLDCIFQDARTKKEWN